MFSISFAIWVGLGVLIWNEAIKDDEIADTLRLFTPTWRAVIGMVIVLMAPAAVIAIVIIALYECAKK